MKWSSDGLLDRSRVLAPAVLADQFQSIGLGLAGNDLVEVGARRSAAVNPAEHPAWITSLGWMGRVIMVGHRGHDRATATNGINGIAIADFRDAGERPANKSHNGCHPWLLP